MINMSFMEKLLDGVEVEWKPLSEVLVSNTGGGTPSKAKPDYWNGQIPWASVGDLSTESHFIESTRNHITDEGLKNSSSNLISKGDLIVAVKISPGKIKIAGVDLAINQDLRGLKLKDVVIGKFIYYFFKTLAFRGNGTIVKSIASKDVEKLLIPIPCPESQEKSLEIQAEIVRVLDKFTELTAELTTELTTELTARQKQYNYYRDQLLSFEEGEVEWKTLGDVAVIGTGRHDTKDAMDDGEFIFYARGRAPLRLNVYDFDETAIITAGDGAGVGKVYHYAQGKYALHQRAYRVVPSEIMDPRFVFHYISAFFYSYIQKVSVSSSVTSLRRPMFINFPIPVPSFAKQARIVGILDKFDALTNSITESLPREIELRQKQYEYYRDLLLNFPKPEVKA
ncbi:restriction endonuclease subunit S [Maridesulfovibrio sp.]|uniref:restriction endonuclease subunit S n=1 Tax=Maridesulfovibrio sp. TaxID=2795000 RepID=UPI0039EF1B0C